MLAFGVGNLATNRVVLLRRGSFAAIGASHSVKVKQDVSQQRAAPWVLPSAAARAVEIDKVFAAKNLSSCVCNDRQDHSRISLQAVPERIADMLRSRPKAMLQLATARGAGWPRAETFLLSCYTNAMQFCYALSHLTTHRFVAPECSPQFGLSPLHQGFAHHAFVYTPTSAASGQLAVEHNRRYATDA